MAKEKLVVTPVLLGQLPRACPEQVVLDTIRAIDAGAGITEWKVHQEKPCAVVTFTSRTLADQAVAALDDKWKLSEGRRVQVIIKGVFRPRKITHKIIVNNIRAEAIDEFYCMLRSEQVPALSVTALKTNGFARVEIDGDGPAVQFMARLRTLQIVLNGVPVLYAHWLPPALQPQVGQQQGTFQMMPQAAYPPPQLQWGDQIVGSPAHWIFGLMAWGALSNPYQQQEIFNTNWQCQQAQNQQLMFPKQHNQFDYATLNGQAGLHQKQQLQFQGFAAPGSWNRHGGAFQSPHFAHLFLELSTPVDTTPGSWNVDTPTWTPKRVQHQGQNQASMHQTLQQQFQGFATPGSGTRHEGLVQSLQPAHLSPTPSTSSSTATREWNVHAPEWTPPHRVQHQGQIQASAGQQMREAADSEITQRLRLELERGSFSTSAQWKVECRDEKDEDYHYDEEDVIGRSSSTDAATSRGSESEEETKATEASSSPTSTSGTSSPSANAETNYTEEDVEGSPVGRVRSMSLPGKGESRPTKLSRERRNSLNLPHEQHVDRIEPDTPH